MTLSLGLKREVLTRKINLRGTSIEKVSGKGFPSPNILAFPAFSF
jgi:hypothetical protein